MGAAGPGTSSKVSRAHTPHVAGEATKCEVLSIKAQQDRSQSASSYHAYPTGQDRESGSYSEYFGASLEGSEKERDML